MKQPDDNTWFEELLENAALSPETQLLAAEDAELARKIEFAQTWLSDLRELRGLEPPASIVLRAKSLLAGGGRMAKIWKSLVSSLEVDSWQGGLAPVRSMSTQRDSRFLRFRAEHYQIELSCRTISPKKGHVSGKLYPADGAPFAVFLYSDQAAGVRTAWSDTEGFFQLPDVFSGDYRLKIELDELELLLPELSFLWRTS